MGAVEITNLRKVYRVGDQKVVALDDVALSIDKGDITCILGTSGSGKTTLLNLMAGLEKPTRGSINIHNVEITKLNEQSLAYFRQRYVGFIFQSYNLLTALTALENVTLPLAFRGVKKSARDKAAREMLELVGLKKYIFHKPTQLSGGQQQRVAIARAFVIRPKIIFADEPTGNLDSRTTAEVMDIILQMSDSPEHNLIIVTHDKDIASYADKIVYLKDGNIEKIDIIGKGGIVYENS